MNSNGHVIDKDRVITLLENQVADLKDQLKKAEHREDELINEKTRLVDMYNEERAERRALMPPPKGSFWDFLRK